jgi:hypothetical protein
LLDLADPVRASGTSFDRRIRRSRVRSGIPSARLEAAEMDELRDLPEDDVRGRFLPIPCGYAPGETMVSAG